MWEFWEKGADGQQEGCGEAAEIPVGDRERTGKGQKIEMGIFGVKLQIMVEIYPKRDDILNRTPSKGLGGAGRKRNKESVRNQGEK